MARSRFPGGAHPPDRKFAGTEAIKELPPPETLFIPVAQHIGVPAVPVVKAKEAVAKGQQIGEAKGFISAPIHSPVSGTIVKIEKRNEGYVQRGSQLVAELMKFSHRQSMQIGPLNLVDVIWETYQLVSKSFDKLIEISIDTPESLPMVGDHSSLSQVMINLCTNARDAMPGGGKLHIKARKGRRHAYVAVSTRHMYNSKVTCHSCPAYRDGRSSYLALERR